MARQVVRRSGLVRTLSPHMDFEVGRPRRIPLEALLVCFQINALERHHQAHVIDAARLLNAMTEDQRVSLGISDFDETQTYQRVDWLYNRLCEVLSAGIEGIDAQFFVDSLVRASIPSRYKRTHSVAVDGTDVESWGTFQGRTTVELDGEAARTQSTKGTPASVIRKQKAKVLAVGPDRRNQYTPDPDARAGHRSANSQHPAGPYIGYELHLGVQVRDVRWTNYIDKTTLTEEVPQLIKNAVLVPAGTHRTKTITPVLISEKESGEDIRDVIWDPGYSECLPETWNYPLQKAGINSTFSLTLAQRGIRPFSKRAFVLDGQLYSDLLPAELRDLPMPPPNLPDQAKAALYEKAFNQRAHWRLVRHSPPDHNGVTRWRCPFCAGLVKSRSFPSTMRRGPRTKIAFLPESVTKCCEGTVSAPPADIPLSQLIPFGTTAWRISMNRRAAVESVNAALNGGYLHLVRGFFRVFGLTKIRVLLGFSLAAVNLDRIRSFEAKKAATEQLPKHRRPRRLGSWRSLIGELDDQSTLMPVGATGPPG
ncbi:MAG: hypothetical protein ACYCSF_02870 [Acidimicrobiales bacterium]